jgi:hypothetical protein
MARTIDMTAPSANSSVNTTFPVNGPVDPGNSQVRVTATPVGSQGQQVSNTVTAQNGTYHSMLTVAPATYNVKAQIVNTSVSVEHDNVTAS